MLVAQAHVEGLPIVSADAALSASFGGTAVPAANAAFERLFGVRTVIIGAELLSRDPGVRENAVRIALPMVGGMVSTRAAQIR